MEYRNKCDVNAYYRKFDSGRAIFMKKRFRGQDYVLSHVIGYAIDAAAIYLLCWYFIKNGNVLGTATLFFLFYMAVGQLNKFYSGLKHILCYILLGRRKEEIKWLKSQFESHGIEPIKLKNNDVDNFLISSAEAGKYSDNREASSILASQWLKNQVLELGCPPMEAWVHRDMIRRALQPNTRKCH